VERITHVSVAIGRQTAKKQTAKEKNKLLKKKNTKNLANPNKSITFAFA